MGFFHGPSWDMNVIQQDDVALIVERSSGFHGSSPRKCHTMVIQYDWREFI